MAEKFPNIDKILYLDSDTIVRKSLLPLWEINLNDKLIAAIEDVSKSKDKAKKEKLKDNLYINAGVLLINTKKWRQIKFFNKINNYIKKYNISDADQGVINVLTDNRKIRLNPEFNYMEVWWRNNTCQYDHEYSEYYKKKDPTIVHFTGIKPNKNNCNNSYRKEFLKYQNISNNLNKELLTIPIVLSSDDKYTPYLYTTMLSILENGYKKTFYVFYLFVPSNFSKTYQNLILKLNDVHKCSIHFIFIKNFFDNILLTISQLSVPTFYNLLVGDLLPQEVDKCIYLDTDIYVSKDLSELYNKDLKDNYIAGVISPDYYFHEKRNRKRLNLPSTKKYINTGMMLMNLKLIRRDNITQKFRELAESNYNLQDQDILNVVCYGKILVLPPKYNAMILSLTENNTFLINQYSEKEIKEAIDTPLIIHYANKSKPWNSIGVHMEKFWWSIAKKTPFINNIFNRENIYKHELKKWWLNIKNKTLNIENPKTFSEKIQWLKIYDTTPIKSYLSDKYLVRKWVKDKIGEEYLIPLLGIYNKFEDIDFKNLTKSFIIECNHGIGYNIIVQDKSKLNLTDVKFKLDKWMNENYAFKNGFELQYKDIKHKIIIEKYINDCTSDLKDYSFLCFNGKPKYILLDFKKHKEYKHYLYELKKNQLSNIINSFNSEYSQQKKIKLLNEMLELSSKLSEGFLYSRIDFYIFNEKIYFNQILFTSSIEIEEIKFNNLDAKLGSLIKLPKIIYNIDTEKFYTLTKIFSLNPLYISLILFISKLLSIYFNEKEQIL